jgi:hypothetical protein
MTANLLCQVRIEMKPTNYLTILFLLIYFHRKLKTANGIIHTITNYQDPRNRVARFEGKSLATDRGGAFARRRALAASPLTGIVPILTKSLQPTSLF